MRSYERLSTDRLRRFISTNRKVLRKKDNFFVSHFVKMLVGEGVGKTEEFVQVLGFRLLKDKNKETNKPFMSLYNADGKIYEDIGVIGSLYRLRLNKDGVLKLNYVNGIKDPISFKHFVKHVEADEMLKYLG